MAFRVISVALVACATAVADASSPAEYRELEVRLATLLREGRGASAEAIAAVERGLELSRAPAQGGRELEARAERAFGRVLIERGDPSAARAHVAQALELERTAAPDDRVAIAETLALLADAALRLRDGSAVTRLLAELAQLPADAPSDLRARVLELRARSERDAGRYDAALDLALQAFDLRDAGPGDEGDRIECLMLLGDLEWFLGRLEASRERYSGIVARATGTLGRGHPLTAKALAGLAVAEYDLGGSEEACRLAEEALAITRAMRGPDHPETADRLQDLANFSQSAGDYPRALSLYEEAMAVAERRFTPRSDEVATLRYNVAVLDWRTGRLAAARSGAEDALAIWEQVFGREHPYLARPLDLLASVALDQGDDDRAASALERALAIHEREGAGQPLDIAWSLAQLASVQRRRQRVEQATATLARAAAICDGVATRVRGRAAALAAVADGEMALGRFDRAAAHYRTALGDYESAFGPWHPATASTQARWAAALVRSGGGRGDAFAAAAQAESVRLAHLRRTLRYLSEGQALDLARRAPEGRDVLLSLAAAPAAPTAQVEAAFEAAVRARGLVFDELAARRPAGVLTGSDPELERARQRLARLLYRQTVSPSEPRASLLAAAHTTLERLERNATRAGRPDPGPGTDPIDVALVRSRLPAGSTLVSFVRYHDMLRGGVDSYLAFVLDARSGVRAVPLGGAAGIEDAVNAWRSGVQDVEAATRRPAASERSSRIAGRALARRVWDPLAPSVNSTGLVLVVPDGALSFVAFGSLPDPSGAYLVEGATIHELSSERDILRPRRPRQVEALLVAGGPAFDAVNGAQASDAPSGGARARAWAQSSDCQGGPIEFAPLPDAAVEAREVAGLWARQGRVSEAQTLVGPSATEAAFKRLAPGHTILHVATHGFFASPCRQPAGSPLQRAWTDNPLMSAGLALAGANRSGQAPEDQEDGLLTAAEVAQLDLRRADLVVLSACGTGLGQAQAGEGVLGLQRAFALAGAGTVVMSLWSVEDAEARAFARSLYESRLARGLSAAASVRAAQLALLRQLRSAHGAAPPSRWAAFVTVGDWR